MYWSASQIRREFREDQIRFLDFERVGDDYIVRTPGGRVVPPPKDGWFMRFMCWILEIHPDRS